LITSIDKYLLCEYVSKQLNVFFPDNRIVISEDIAKYFDDTIYRLEYCFKNIHRPYYNQSVLIFNHLHGDHYAMFLYLLSNTVWKADQNEQLASKIFLLNKALHGIDAFYSVELPEIFLFIHPVGTILGKAQYKNYFAVYQNCTVGASEDNSYPFFSEEILMYSKSSVIGDCNIGRNVVFAANTSLINTNIKDNKLVLDSYPNNKVIENNKNVIDRIFK